MLQAWWLEGCSKNTKRYDRLNPLTVPENKGRDLHASVNHVKARLVKLAKRPVFTLLTLALVVLGSLSVYAAVTDRNPLCFSLTVHGLINQMSVGNLTKASETILRGSVSQVGPSWVSSGMTYTDITVEAAEFLKGSLPRTTVQLRILGGTTTCGGVWVEDQPSFAKGEEVLLFLASSNYVGPGTSLAVVGGPQGKYTIVNGNAWWGTPSNAVPLDDLIAEINRNL